MLSKSAYEMLARHLGRAMAIAEKFGGQTAYNEIYENVYRPMVADLQSDNPNFRQLDFSYAASIAMGKYDKLPDWMHNA